MAAVDLSMPTVILPQQHNQEKCTCVGSVNFGHDIECACAHCDVKDPMYGKVLEYKKNIRGSEQLMFILTPQMFTIINCRDFEFYYLNAPGWNLFTVNDLGKRRFIQFLKFKINYDKIDTDVEVVKQFYKHYSAERIYFAYIVPNGSPGQSMDQLCQKQKLVHDFYKHRYQLTPFHTYVYYDN